MTLGQVAALIAAIAFALLVVLLAVPLLKLGKVFDQLSNSIAEITEEANATVEQATQTIRDANAQLSKVDAVTTSAAQVAQDISALSTLTSATLAKPLIKLSAFSYATRKLISRREQVKED